MGYALKREVENELIVLSPVSSQKVVIMPFFPEKQIDSEQYQTLSHNPTEDPASDGLKSYVSNEAKKIFGEFGV